MSMASSVSRDVLVRATLLGYLPGRLAVSTQGDDRHPEVPASGLTRLSTRKSKVPGPAMDPRNGSNAAQQSVSVSFPTRISRPPQPGRASCATGAARQRFSFEGKNSNAGSSRAQPAGSHSSG
jgi:hypothetical protein